MNVWLRIADDCGSKRPVLQQELSGPHSTTECASSFSIHAQKYANPRSAKVRADCAGVKKAPLSPQQDSSCADTFFAAPGQVDGFRASIHELLDVRRRRGREIARLFHHLRRRRVSQGADRNAPATVRSRRRVVGQETQGSMAKAFLERVLHGESR